MTGEFERIDLFLQAFQSAGGRVEGGVVQLGPGDDAAILSSPRRLVVTTDALVEGVHFRLDWATPEQIGHKALAVNLSDLAAMGARAETFTCALALPLRLTDAELAGLGRGMGTLAAKTGAVLAGGNFTKASELSLTITAMGSLESEALRRDTARPGDGVLLFGATGVAAAELRWLLRSDALPDGHSALHEPQPLLDAGERAAKLFRCGIDVSDGLAQDLGHIAKRSGVKVVVDVAHLPRTARFETLTADCDEREKLRLLLAGGEDYALVVFGELKALETLRQDVGGRLIGRVAAGSGVAFEGLPADVSLAGHDHFRDG